MTSLTGSVLMALAVAHGTMTADAAFAAANVDEDYQMRHWGADEEALARLARGGGRRWGRRGRCTRWLAEVRGSQLSRFAAPFCDKSPVVVLYMFCQKFGTVAPLPDISRVICTWGIR